MSRCRTACRFLYGDLLNFCQQDLVLSGDGPPLRREGHQLESTCRVCDGRGGQAIRGLWNKDDRGSGERVTAMFHDSFGSDNLGTFPSPGVLSTATTTAENHDARRQTQRFSARETHGDSPPSLNEN